MLYSKFRLELGIPFKYHAIWLRISSTANFSFLSSYKLFKCSKTYLGDINQSLFLQESFKNEFNGNLIKLNNSYRSSKQIFDFLNLIIKNEGVNTVNREGNPVEIIECNDIDEMLNNLIQEIKNYQGKSMGIVVKSFKEAKKIYNSIN